MIKQIKDIVIIVLLLLLLLQKCNTSNTSIISPKHFRDTTIVKLSGDTTINNFQPIKTIPYLIVSKDTQYIADTNYNVLKQQFESLRDSLLLTKIYNDTFKIATVGSAQIKTTIFKNNVIEQKFNYNISYPIIKDCVIITAPPKNQVYFGIGLQGNPSTLITQFNGNILFKNKKDNILGVQAGISPNGIVNYGISTFWKIKL
jgi:hypothetical protein